ncbi:MAG: HAD family hydrolase [Rhodocyclaceae bacterium]|nr:HAD family hydrolase [Rhodocyclaceae bacterium]MBX3667156.1 HAD family hydrolase [Rhodocyclaceae bacterium]
MQKPLLVLDLDETLMHASMYGLPRTLDFRIGPYGALKRPYVAEFIEFCLEYFEVAVWTSSSETYAQIAVKELFPSPDRLAFLWSREHCGMEMRNGGLEVAWIKNLQRVEEQGYALARMIAIDDSPEKYCYQPENLLPCAPFYGDPADHELLDLADYLDAARREGDLRRLELAHWKQVLAATAGKARD